MLVFEYVPEGLLPLINAALLGTTIVVQVPLPLPWLVVALLIGPW